MPVIEHKLTIQRQLFDVFKLATEYKDFPKWQSGTKDVRITSGEPVRAGTMVTIIRNNVFINADILEFQRNKLVKMQGVWGRFRFVRTQEFTSNAGRETQIKDHINVQTGFLYFWYAPILRMQISNQLRSDWAAIKKQLEG
jgi:uncharacterized membrane protein